MCERAVASDRLGCRGQALADDLLEEALTLGVPMKRDEDPAVSSRRPAEAAAEVGGVERVRHWDSARIRRKTT